MKFPAGTQVGPYEIQSLLGSGGMGEVYRARDLRLGRSVAVKILPQEASLDPQRLNRFEQEARSASMLNHPNIITIYDIGRHGSVPFIAMELVEGKTLRQHLNHGPLSVKELLEISVQLSEGLACAHAAGITHRDLKPENIIIGKDNRVKIVDFGLAKLSRAETSPAEGSQYSTLAPETQTGVLLGTVGYMSPEQASGQPVDSRSDQFSMGCILYEMATGKHPFKRSTVAETLVAIIREQPEAVESLNPRLPDPLVWIVRRCLAKNPDERYSSIGDIARQLHDLRDHVIPSGTRISQTSIRSDRKTAKLFLPIVISFLFLIVLGTVVWISTSHDEDRNDSRLPAPSIAVLPFANFSDRTEEEYFADGITEALITELAKMEGMLVIARNSVFQYKGKNVNIKKVGQELNVNYVLEGSVQHSADRIRVHAQLIDVRTGYHLWADRYDRSLSDVFAVQDEISRNIASALRLKLTHPVVAAQPTKNLEAYDAYLRGSYFLNRNVAEDLPKAISLLEKAVVLDPDFAPAHAALGKAFRQHYFFVDPNIKWEEKAFVAIEKAIAIDANLADAYAARGRLRWTRQNNYPHTEAARDYQKAIELNPNLAEAYGYLGGIYYHVGLIKEAISECDKAIKLDPTNPVLRGIRIQAYMSDFKYEEVLAQAGNLADAQAWKAFSLRYLGRQEESESVLKSVLEKEMQVPGNPISSVQDLSFLQSAYAVLAASAGRSEEAEKYIQLAIQNDRGLGTYHHTEYNIASAYALMNNRDGAMEWLRKTSDHGFTCYPLFANDPSLKSLRNDPEFRHFLNKSKEEMERYRAELLTN